MATIECTPVSCGVDFFHGFEELSPEEIMADFISNYKQLQDDVNNSRRSRPTSTFIFSDVQGSWGDAFGQRLSEWFPGTAVVSQKGLNPNSGNKIITYLWTPTLKELRTWPEWKSINPRQSYNDWRRS